MPTALIFGVDGQDGSYLAELLLDKGYQVVGWISKLIPVKMSNLIEIKDKIIIIEGDFRETDSIEEVISYYLPQEVYNLASPSSPVESWKTPIEYGDIAGLSVVRLLEGIKKGHPSARLYQASSSEMFGNPVEVPQNEKTPFRPRNPYGIAKLYSHWMTVRYRERYDIFAVSGILYNHESPRKGKKFVTRKITNHTAKIKLGLKDELRLGNLDACRDWGFAGDYVKAMWLMLQQSTPMDFVIGTGKTHSVREFCEIAFQHVGLDWKEYVVVDSNFYRPSESQQLVANPSCAQRMIGWQSEVKFEQLVRLMVDADLENLKQEKRSRI